MEHLNAFGLWLSTSMATPAAQSWAAWAQAIGSVVAIFVAIRLGSAQRSADLARQRLVEKSIIDRQMAVITTLADHSCHHLRAIPDGMVPNDFQRYAENFNPKVFETPGTALRKIGPAEVPGGNVLLHVLGILDCLDRAPALVNELYMAFLARSQSPEGFTRKQDELRDLVLSGEANRKRLSVLRNELAAA
jgi:hypothetical protein